MIEDLASNFLAKYLGDYVEGLDKSNFKVRLTSGDVVLTNLRLNKNLFEELDLPFVVKSGYLGKLTLKIPWKSLSSKPAEIRIENVFLIAASARKQSLTEEDEKQRLILSKLRRLKIAELMGLDMPEDKKKR